MRHHTHDHGALDPALHRTEQGIAAIKWSAVALVLAALIQSVVVLVSGSMALLADTIHNLADAASGLPLWLAFILARQLPTKRFTYGYGRAEDFAGLFIVLIIVGSGIVVAYESMMHLWNPPTVERLWAVGLASVIGFLAMKSWPGIASKWVMRLAVRPSLPMDIMRGPMPCPACRCSPHALVCG